MKKQKTDNIHIQAQIDIERLCHIDAATKKKFDALKDSHANTPLDKYQDVFNSIMDMENNPNNFWNLLREFSIETGIPEGCIRVHLGDEIDTSQNDNVVVFRDHKWDKPYKIIEQEKYDKVWTKAVKKASKGGQSPYEKVRKLGYNNQRKLTVTLRIDIWATQFLQNEALRERLDYLCATVGIPREKQKAMRRKVPKRPEIVECLDHKWDESHRYLTGIFKLDTFARKEYQEEYFQEVLRNVCKRDGVVRDDRRISGEELKQIEIFKRLTDGVKAKRSLRDMLLELSKLHPEYSSVSQDAATQWVVDHFNKGVFHVTGESFNMIDILRAGVGKKTIQRYRDGFSAKTFDSYKLDDLNGEEYAFESDDDLYAKESTIREKDKYDEDT